MKTYDLIVIGAGVAGSATAYAAAGRLSVLLLERYPFLHGRGSSHGASRIFRHAYEDARYVRLARAAEEAWRRLERDAGESLLRTVGGVDIAPAADPGLAAIEAALAAAGSPSERLEPGEVARRYPAMRLGDGEAALFQASTGILAADRAVLAMLRTAAVRGAELRDEEEVTSLEPTEGGVRVTSRNGSYEAGAVVVCAGPWLGSLLPTFAPALRVERQQVLYLRTLDPKAFEPGVFPVFIHRTTGVYGFPLFEAPTSIKVSNHTGARAIRLEERSFELDEASARDTVERVRRFVPGLASTWRDYQTCLYTKTPDEDFILGRHPSLPNVVVGGGFSGHGFKFGPVLGEALSALALGEGTPHDLTAFAPDRPALLPATAKQATPGGRVRR